MAPSWRCAERRGQGAAGIEVEDLLEARKLSSGVGRLRVSASARWKILYLDVLAPKRGLQQTRRAVPVHADSLHPRVDLEVDPCAGAEGAAQDSMACSLSMEDAVMVRSYFRNSGSWEPMMPRGMGVRTPACRGCPPRGRRGEIRNSLLHQAGHRDQAMAVGVGLEDWHHLDVGSDVRTDGVQVAGQAESTSTWVGRRTPSSAIVGSCRGSAGCSCPQECARRTASGPAACLRAHRNSRGVDVLHGHAREIGHGDVVGRHAAAHRRR